MRPKVDDNALIAAIVRHGSPTRAAAAVGCGVATVHRRLLEPLFAAKVQEARAAQLFTAAQSLTDLLPSSIEALRAIQDDVTAADRDRIHAANSIIATCIRVRNEAYTHVRLATLEAAFAELKIPLPAMATVPPLTLADNPYENGETL